MTSLVKERMVGEAPVVKLLAFCLADYADPEGGDIYPSVATLARHVGVSERTIQRAMERLIVIGFVRLLGACKGGSRARTPTGKRRGLTNRYRINPNWWRDSPDRLTGLEAEGVTGPLDAPSGVTASPDKAVSPEYSIEDSIQVNQRAGLDVQQSVIPPDARESLRQLGMRLRQGLPAAANKQICSQGVQDD